MEDKTGGERPGWVGFRSYADDSVRPDLPDDVDAAKHAGRMGYPLGQELKIRYDEAAGPNGRVFPSRRARLVRAAAVAAVACGATVIALFVARPDGPTSVRPGNGANLAPATKPQLRVELAPDPTAAPPHRPPAPMPMTLPEPSALIERPNHQATSRSVARVEQPAARDPARAATAGADADVTTAAHPVRVFVHVTDPAQYPMADRIRSELSDMRFADLPVGTPPVRIVAASPRRTEVRCLKRADCPAASRVARHLAETLNAPVAVVDMSSRYERDRRVRPGSLELWLRL